MRWLNVCRMVQISTNMRKKQKAARDYVQKTKRMINDDINTSDMEEAFIAGVDWQNNKAIEAFKFATDGYFIIGGTDYSAKRLNEFIEKLNS
jgi:hypothetical protein